MEKLTHFDEKRQAIMVDVTVKFETSRTAIAKGRIRVSEETMRAVLEGTAAKGDVLGVARVACIMAVKRTGDLIPMCHPLPIGNAPSISASTRRSWRSKRSARRRSPGRPTWERKR